MVEIGLQGSAQQIDPEVLKKLKNQKVDEAFARKFTTQKGAVETAMDQVKQYVNKK